MLTDAGRAAIAASNRRRALARTSTANEAIPCPECGAPKVNPETLRAHRAIAHGVTS